MQGLDLILFITHTMSLWKSIAKGSLFLFSRNPTVSNYIVLLILVSHVWISSNQLQCKHLKIRTESDKRFCLPYSPGEIVYIFSNQLPEGFLFYIRTHDHIPTSLTPLESWVGRSLNFIGYSNNSNHQDPLPPPPLDVVNLLSVHQKSQTYSERVTNYRSSLAKLTHSL